MRLEKAEEDTHEQTDGKEGEGSHIKIKSDEKNKR